MYALVNERSDAEFRAVSNGDDTVLRRTDGVNGFDVVAAGDTCECRDINTTNWRSFTITYATQNRITTWDTPTGYIGRNDGVTQCGNGISYSSAHPYVQQIDTSYVGSNVTMPDVFYVR